MDDVPDFDMGDSPSTSVDALIDTRFYVDLLYRFSVSLRSSSRRLRIQRTLEDSQSVQSPYHDVYKNHVSEKFRGLNKQLVERFAKTMVLRVYMLDNGRHHNEKMTKGMEYESEEGMLSSTESTSVPGNLEKEGNLEMRDTGDDPVDDSISEASMSSLAFTDSDISRRQPPSLPERGQNGQPFVCPLCFAMVCFETTRQWQ